MSRRPVPEGGCRPVPLRKGNRKRLNGPPGIPFFARRTGPRSPSGLVPGGERRNRGLKHKRRAVRMQRKFPAVPGKGPDSVRSTESVFFARILLSKTPFGLEPPFQGKSVPDKTAKPMRRHVPASCGACGPEHGAGRQRFSSAECTGKTFRRKHRTCPDCLPDGESMRTKIIATIGPASASREMLVRLTEAGASIFQA